MFDKTSSRIKQFISSEKNKDVQENEYFGQKRQLKPKSWRSQDRKAMDIASVQSTNRNGAEHISSPPLPSLLYSQYSLRPCCGSGCNLPIRSSPHSLSKFDSHSEALQDLSLTPDKSPGMSVLNESSSEITFLPPNTSVKNLCQTTPASQLDLLEALALGPVKNGKGTPHQESLTTHSPKSSDMSKDSYHLIRKTNDAFEASGSTLFGILATNQELNPNQDETNLITKKMSPRIEPRRRYRTHIPPTVTINHPENSLAQQSERHQQHRVHHIRGSNPMNKLSASPNSLQVLDEMRKRSLNAPSCNPFQRKIGNRRVESNGIDHFRGESLSENDLRSPSETSRSTASGSAVSIPLEPFYLEDLPLRIKLAEGLLPERPVIQDVETCQPTALVLATHNPTHARRFNMEVREGQYRRVSKHEVVLKSTNFSLTSLGYKHGDIRVQQRSRPYTKSGTGSSARPSLAASHTTKEVAESSTSRYEDGDGLQYGELDLPGFQTAISGAWVKECRVCLADGPYQRHDELEVKVDELVKWCDDFDLDMGRLVNGHHSGGSNLRDEDLRMRRWRRRQLNLDPSTENLFSTVEPLNYRRFGIGDEDDLSGPPPYECIKIKGGISLKTGKDENGIGNHEGETSLPPSPMQNISPSALSRPESFIPMGYNVDHDLSDYLKWKSECANSPAEGDI